MKKLLFFFMFSLSTWLLPAQDYIPLVQEQATWIIHSYCFDAGDDFSQVFGFRVEGDTLIDGISYKKVYHLSFFSSIENWPFPPYRKSGQQLFGAIREDMDELNVYARIFEETELDFRCTDPGTEKLWYDFALEVGDTLPSCISFFPSYPDYRDTIVSIDTAFLFGEERRLWTIWGDRAQVEGLGTHTGLFDPFFDYITFPECSYYLLHYCIGTEADCDIVDATSVRELVLPASSISIEPNPAWGPVTVRLPGEEGRIEHIALFDLSGQLMREWRGNGSGLQEIDAGHLPGGVYMLRVHSAEKAGWGRLVIAK